MTCASDWIGLNCGDIVHLDDDPRHLGEVSAVSQGMVRVVWQDTKWISDCEIRRLVVVERVARPHQLFEPMVVAPPKRRLGR